MQPIAKAAAIGASLLLTAAGLDYLCRGTSIGLDSTREKVSNVSESAVVQLGVYLAGVLATGAAGGLAGFALTSTSLFHSIKLRGTILLGQAAERVQNCCRKSKVG
jgi:hypothetical protein